MISRQTKLQLLVFGLIALVGMTFTGVRYAGLGTAFHLTDPGYLVAADFRDSGGIFKGAEVTYRGVTRGKVETLTLRPDGVRAMLRLRPGTKVPNQVKAVVANRSAVGEQYVDLQPQRDGGPYLRGSDVIPVSMTSIPIQPTQLVVNLDDFVTSIDTKQLAITLDELGMAFDGAGPSLQRLVDSGDALTNSASDALPETKRLIEDGKTALDTQRDVSGQFKSFNRDLATLTDQLRASDPDFRRLFANGRDSAVETTDLLESNRSALPVLLSNLITVAQVQQVRIPAIKQILVTYPNVVAGGFTVVPGDGTTHFGLVSDSSPKPCQAGYGSTKQRKPEDTSLRTPNLNAYCAESAKTGVDVRGAQNEPRPAGEKPFPAGGSTGQGKASSSSSSSSPSSSSPPPIPPIPPIPGLGGGARIAPSGAGDSVLLGDYNPVTGNVITEDGQRLTIGSSAGAQQLFGKSAWQWLLLGPLAQ